MSISQRIAQLEGAAAQLSDHGRLAPAEIRAMLNYGTQDETAAELLRLAAMLEDAKAPRKFLHLLPHHHDNQQLIESLQALGIRELLGTVEGQRDAIERMQAEAVRRCEDRIAERFGKESLAALREHWRQSDVRS